MQQDRRKLLERARRQAALDHGVTTRAALLRLGFSEGAIHRLVASGELIRSLPAVYRFSSAPRTWEQRQFAVCEWAGEGSASSGLAAAYLHRIEGFGPDVHEATLTGKARPAPAGVVLHRSAQPLGRIIRIDRIPCTDVWRTLFDLASRVDEARLEAALDDLLYRGRITPDRAIARLQDIGTKGRRGRGLLMDLLHERLTAPASQQIFNVKLRRAFRASRVLPMPQVEFPIYVGDRFLARADFAYPEALLAIEGQSRKHHTGADWSMHNRRLNLLTEHGWLVLNATWDVFDDGCHGFFEQVRRVREERLCLFKLEG